MIKKLARWVLREELDELAQLLSHARYRWFVWKGRYDQLAIQTFGEGFSPFPKDEE